MGGKNRTTPIKLELVDTGVPEYRRLLLQGSYIYRVFEWFASESMRFDQQGLARGHTQSEGACVGRSW